MIDLIPHQPEPFPHFWVVPRQRLDADSGSRKQPERGQEAVAVVGDVAERGLLRQHRRQTVELTGDLADGRSPGAQCGEHLGIGTVLATKARAAYLARHERAGYWVDFDDFGFWRLNVLDVYFVGGFAAMDWVTAADYTAAAADPLADVGGGIVAHMNADHADALVAYAKHFAGEEADEATMVTVDRLGFKLRLRQGQRLSSVRIAFPREVTTAAQSREVLIDMLRQARGA